VARPRDLDIGTTHISTIIARAEKNHRERALLRIMSAAFPALKGLEADIALECPLSA